MTNTTIALVFVMFANVLLWFSQVAIIELNEDGTQFYNCEGTIMENYGNCEGMVISGNVEDNLPSSATVSEGGTGIFTDIFNNILSWIKGLPGVNYLYAMVTSPYNLLKAIGLPSEVCFGLGVIWYGITLFLLISFLWGRE